MCSVGERRRVALMSEESHLSLAEGLPAACAAASERDAVAEIAPAYCAKRNCLRNATKAHVVFSMELRALVAS